MEPHSPSPQSAPLLPLREKVDRPKAETDEGLLASIAEHDLSRWKQQHPDWRATPIARLRGFAQSMRATPTEAERRLWALVRDRRLAQFKFRRQVPIGRYIVDVLCAQRKLIVELDGSQHAESASDMARDRWLTARGFRVLRVWNNDMLARREAVLDTITAALEEHTP